MGFNSGFKGLKHLHWLNTGRGQITTGSMWCTFVLSEGCASP